VQLFEKDAKTDAGVVIESLKIYIERVERPKNFMLNDESLEAKRRILVEKQIRAAELFVKLKVSREAILEREIKK
jgi:hypothetical protein